MNVCASGAVCEFAFIPQIFFCQKGDKLFTVTFQAYKECVFDTQKNRIRNITVKGQFTPIQKYIFLLIPTVPFFSILIVLVDVAEVW